ncbi:MULTISPECIES: NUDIX hydrolase [unclassified Granulicatella]|uniref:NUDIX hydrolase n=1 Tax=unclassified Granulicatella TaxID=2630493 RepID=UPI0010739293|nr:MULTISPECIES: NUDIX hydrolase [unclassified Granulicatella]MBF0779882.1 NUDIX hydrolase [Granulicatella sp. 19428wC4_WM01]TFU96086.1 NUDIX hydrolase [Granulicatella sp. WM01]
MCLNEPTIRKELKYTGRIFSVEQHHVTLPNGKTALRDVILHNGAVAIIAITPENKLVLVKQYRKGVEKMLIEIPAGMLDKKGELPLAAAQRELIEETRYEAREWEKVITMSMSPGYLSEEITLFLAKGLFPTTLSHLTLDEDEFVEVLELSRKDVEEYIKIGLISDAKTLYAILYWDLLVDRGVL